MRSLFYLLIAIAAPCLSASAQASRICIEEVGGVCLKYQDAPEPEPLSPVEEAERRLGMGAAERRDAQSALAAEGFYDGAIDGALGPQSRRAIRNWQAARGEDATGFLTGAQITELKKVAAQSATDAAQVEAEPAGAEAATPSHPEPGRVYRAGHTTLHGTEISVEVTRIDDAQAKVTLMLQDGGASLEDACIVEIEANVTCYMRRSGWNMIVLSGRLPRIVASETEAMPQVKIRADREVFELW